jgi:microcystin degradation protein MlrC
MKNIAVGGFFHESNTFNPIITGAEDFIVFEGDEIYSKGELYPQAKGIVDYLLEKPEYSVTPLVFARAVPNGEVDTEFYTGIKDRFFEMLDAAPKPDAFVLALHGSMRVKGIGSAESDLLLAIKARYPEVPIFCGLDMHATFTWTMFDTLAACVGYKTAPHTDAWETGRKAAEMMDMFFCQDGSMSMAVRKIDCLIAGEKAETNCEPMRSLIAELERLETSGETISASLLLGFPWADAEDNGVTALVVAQSTPEHAQSLADNLAKQFMAKGRDFSFSMPAYPPEEALRLALREEVRPVFVSDSGDNPTAGSTGDNTTILSLLWNELRQDIGAKRILAAGIYDPEAFAFCRQFMELTSVVHIGGRFDTLNCEPLVITGEPVKLVEAFGPYASGLILYRTAIFDLIITSRHIGFTSPDMFTALGIAAEDYDIVVVKLGYLTEEFKPLAKKAYMALTPGCSDEVLERLRYSAEHKLI